MKVLVNGGLGFVGINLINYLQDEMDLVIVDALVEGSRFDIIKKFPDKYNDLKIYGGEKFLAKDAYLKILMDEKPDVIVNLASLSHVDSSFTNPSIFYRYNIEYFNNLLQAVSEFDKQIKVIHMSTDEVFGSIEDGQSINEDNYTTEEEFDILTYFYGYNPSSPYSITKTTQEMIFNSMIDSEDLNNAIIFRSTNLFGKYQDESKLIPKIIKNIKEGKPIPVYGDGLQKRTWLHISECVQFIKDLILSKESFHKEDFHISNKNNEVTNLELIFKIGDIIGKQPSIDYVKDRKNHDKRYFLDYEYTSELTGFEPLITLEAGLRSVINA